MSSAPIARFYADLKRTQKEIRNDEKQERSLAHLQATRERLLTQVLPKDRSKWTKAQRRWFEGVAESVQRCLKNQEAAAEAIEKRKAALEASIRQEDVHRRDTMETRRRQQTKEKERSPR